MTIESATQSGIGYPRFRQRAGQPKIVESQAGFRRPWLFEAECHSPDAAREWIWRKSGDGASPPTKSESEGA